ncbi:MAG TPA: type II secretion system F family protein [Thermoplasmata archaeon]|nr:type II secretion system F family protein [Thermoplasmata archaeon]
MATATPPARAVRRVAAAPLRSDADAPRTVRVPKGDQPSHSQLTGFQRWCWNLFKDKVHSKPADPLLDENLLKAHIRMRADEYMAIVYGTTVAAALGLVGVGIGVFVFLLVALALAPGVAALAFLLPLASLLALVVLPGQPAARAKARGRNIDRRISIAMNFMSAMASADVNIDQIFKELSNQTEIYGEVAEEAAWITRDTELLGVDILTAIKEGAVRSPSKRFQDFLQGVVTTATSGGQLKPYFLLKAEQYERENKLALLQRTETMGLMAEVFVIGVVAFPLFLIIILAIFAIIGGNGAFVLELLWVIVGLVIPLVEFGFIFIMNVFATEA